MEEICGDDDASVGALEWRLRRSIEQNDLFHPEDNVPLDEIVNPGQCTVLQMDTLGRWNQQLITTVLLRRMYRERLDAVRNRDPQIEHPIFALFEEGQRFAPSSDNAPSLDIMRPSPLKAASSASGWGSSVNALRRSVDHIRRPTTPSSSR